MKRTYFFVISVVLTTLLSSSVISSATESFSTNALASSLQDEISDAKRLWDISFVDYYVAITNIGSRVEAEKSLRATCDFAHIILDQLSLLPISIQQNRFGNAERTRMILTCKAAKWFGDHSPDELVSLLARVLHKIKSGIITAYVPKTETGNSLAFAADPSMREAHLARVRTNMGLNASQQSLRLSVSRIMPLLCRTAWAATKEKSEVERIDFLTSLAETANLSTTERRFLFEGIQPVTVDASIVLVHGAALGSFGTNRVIRRSPMPKRKAPSLIEPKPSSF